MTASGSDNPAMTLAMTINGQWGYQQQWTFSQYESNPKKCEGSNTDIYIVYDHLSKIVV